MKSPTENNQTDIEKKEERSPKIKRPFKYDILKAQQELCLHHSLLALPTYLPTLTFQQPVTKPTHWERKKKKGPSLSRHL